ncbi:hypothetical protein [Streptomyces iakyrus]
MGDSGRNAEPESGRGNGGTQSKLALVSEFAGVALALAALIVSIIAMTWQTETAREQTELTAEQKDLAADQRDLEASQAEEARLPKVSYWMLPVSPTDSGGGLLYIVNRDKDAITWFYIQAGGQQGSLNFVPSCTRTTIPLSQEIVNQMGSDTDGWAAHFRSGEEWWTFDNDSFRVLKSEVPSIQTDEPSLSWTGVEFTPEPDCET